MRRRTLSWWVIVAVTAACAAPVASSASSSGSLHVTVKPGVGTARTHFAVGFRPQASGTTGSTYSRYAVEASGRSGKGCSSSAVAVAPSSPAGQLVRVTLRPGNPSGKWCRGSYAGRVEETIRPVCSFGKACPLFIAVLTVGKFSFRVT